MTKQRNDEHSTEFGLWLRGQLPEQKLSVDAIDSSLGYIATNLDYIWGNYKTEKWMLIEEKRHGRKPSFPQKEQFRALHRACKGTPGYNGLHLIVFENTSPEDGRIWINNKQVDIYGLMDFLMFKGSP